MRRTKEDSEQTRQDILRAAIEVFSEKGVSKATLDNIAKQANVTRGAVYWHFKNKIEIFDALCERLHRPFIETILNELEKDHTEPLQQLRDLCIKILIDLDSNCEKKQILKLFMLKCDYSGELEVYKEKHNANKLEKVKAFAQYFEKAKRQNKLSQSVDSELMALSLSCYLKGIVIEYLDNESDFNLKTTAPKLINAFFMMY